MKGRRPRKPRRGVSRSGCHRIAKILVWSLTRPETLSRRQEEEVE